MLVVAMLVLWRFLMLNFLWEIRVWLLLLAQWCQPIDLRLFILFNDLRLTAPHIIVCLWCANTTRRTLHDNIRGCLTVFKSGNQLFDLSLHAPSLKALLDANVRMVHLLLNVFQHVLYRILLLSSLPSLKNALRDVKQPCLVALLCLQFQKVG